MSLETALDRTTDAINRLIAILDTARAEAPVQEAPQAEPVEPQEAPVTVNVTCEQAQAAAARAVARLGNSPEAKQKVKDMIAKHGKTIKDLDQLQRNAVYCELEAI